MRFVRVSHANRFISQEITLADLFHLPYGSLLPKQNIDFLESGKYPNVARYAREARDIS